MRSHVLFPSGHWSWVTSNFMSHARVIYYSMNICVRVCVKDILNKSLHYYYYLGFCKASRNMLTLNEFKNNNYYHKVVVIRPKTFKKCIPLFHHFFHFFHLIFFLHIYLHLFLYNFLHLLLHVHLSLLYILHLLPPSLNKLPHRFQLPPLPTSPPSAFSCSTLTSTLSNLKHQLICTCRTKTCMRVKVFCH